MSESIFTRKPYSGTKRKLVLAFDVGTTFSGISYALVHFLWCCAHPGKVPEIRGVTQFPAQENVGGDCKIPTLLYYDAKGDVRAAGAEARDEAIEEMAQEEGWTKAKWFKLHLGAKTAANAHEKLPSGLFSDFLRYLRDCARSFIEERHANGVALWSSLVDEADYVLTHPNGWEGGQQQMMRQAAIKAGLVTNDPKGRSRVSFLTEGEASLHFCIQSEMTTDAIKDGKGILVVDAGGGTIDISAYRYVKDTGYEEAAVPQCHVQGSVIVTSRAEAFLEDYLKDSKFSGEAKYIAESFDKTTKPVFRNVEDWQFIKFGSPNDREDDLNIKRGQLKLPGTTVAEFFQPSVDCIINSVEEQMKTAPDIKSIFLVGGFAANSYLFKKIRDKFSPAGVDVSRPDPNRVNKAVAEGAASFHLHHFVSSRMARFDYGAFLNEHFDATVPAHQLRRRTAFVNCIGQAMLPDWFSNILTKGTKVAETQEFRQPFCVTSLSKDNLKKVQTRIVHYRGLVKGIEWRDEDPDTSTLSETLELEEEAVGHSTVECYRLDCDIVLTLGTTEFKAHIAWKENGIEKTGPAEIIYDVDPDDCEEYDDDDGSDMD
ncbi:hypothetical protein BJ165DRAFT_1403445 [Panaeolus papilionaceus]|nr:hypothetical protein BJ165DRAFT_1403445 [Panaeolus papilionaceus]